MNSDAKKLESVIRLLSDTETPRKIKLKEKVFLKGELADIRQYFTSDWYIANLFDITHLITCGVAKRPDYLEEGIPFLSAQNTRPFRANLNKIKYVSKEAFEQLTVGGKPESGDVLYTRVGNCGEAAKVEFDFDFAIYVSLTLIKPYRTLLNTDYLVAYLNSQFGLLQAAQGAIGIGLKNLNVDNVRRYIIPLPPLAEQKIIADKLDTLLAQVENTKARLDRIPEILKTFRQSVLAAAVSGKLTEEWRGGVNFAFNSKELGRLARFIDYRGKTPVKTTTGIPLITAKNIRQGFISREPREFIADEDYDSWMTRGIPNYGDVLITTEAPMGYVANIDIKENFALAQRAICLQLNEDINPYYASIFMQSSGFQKALDENATGSTVKGIKAALLKKIDLAYPSIKEQTQIVHRVEELFDFADTIEQKTNAALERVNNLTQSILAKAFRGELTADWRAENPDLISGENSAEALLAKIKAEREKLALEKKAANKTRKKKA